MPAELAIVRMLRSICTDVVDVAFCPPTSVLALDTIPTGYEGKGSRLVGVPPLMFTAIPPSPPPQGIKVDNKNAVADTRNALTRLSPCVKKFTPAPELNHHYADLPDRVKKTINTQFMPQLQVPRVIRSSIWSRQASVKLSNNVSERMGKNAKSTREKSLVQYKN